MSSRERVEEKKVEKPAPKAKPKRPAKLEPESEPVEKKVEEKPKEEKSLFSQILTVITILGKVATIFLAVLGFFYLGGGSWARHGLATSMTSVSDFTLTVRVIPNEFYATDNSLVQILIDNQWKNSIYSTLNVSIQGAAEKFHLQCTEAPNKAEIYCDERTYYRKQLFQTQGMLFEFNLTANNASLSSDYKICVYVEGIESPKNQQQKCESFAIIPNPAPEVTNASGDNQSSTDTGNITTSNVTILESALNQS